MGAEVKATAFAVRLEEHPFRSLDRLAETTVHLRNWLVARAAGDYLALDSRQPAKVGARVAAAIRDDFASDEEIARARGKFADRE